MIKQKDVEIALSLSFIIMLAVFTVSPKVRQEPISNVLLSSLGLIFILILTQRLGSMELPFSNGSETNE